MRIKKHVDRLLVWGFVCSIILHFAGGPLLVWLFGIHMKAAEQQPVERVTHIAISSALKWEHQPRPKPAQVHVTPPLPQPKPVQAHQPEMPRPVQQRRELARINPRASIDVPRLSQRPVQNPLSRQLAEQQQLFTKTIARLREENDPVVSAARPVSMVEAPKRYAYDFSGKLGTLHAEGILNPIKTWHDGPYVYHYLRYFVQYADGTNEWGDVPWPVRYLPQSDPFRVAYQTGPLPGPPPGWVLPSDVSLHPLIAFCLEHHFPECPIMHD